MSVTRIPGGDLNLNRVAGFMKSLDLVRCVKILMSMDIWGLSDHMALTYKMLGKY